MAKLQYILGVSLWGLSHVAYATDFEFDRLGESMSTSTTPVGRVAWEQSLPSATYIEDQVLGQKVRETQLQADMLFRTGLTDSLELQLGWDGPMWSQRKVSGQTIEDDGLGDVSIGLKKAIALPDEKLSLAVMASATLASGSEQFSHGEDIYTVASALNYQYDDMLQTAINMRYEWQDGDWSMVAIPSLIYQLNDRWTGFSEWAYRKTEGEKYQSELTSGVLYAVSDRMQLDASIGFDLDGGPTRYSSTLGVAFLF